MVTPSCPRGAPGCDPFPQSSFSLPQIQRKSHKHGLTGEGVVLSSEDQEQVAGRFAGMMEEFSPTTIMGGVLVKRAAMLSVRLDRSYRQEAANLSVKVASAESDLKDRRLAEAEHLLKEIKLDPMTNRRRLLATPEGLNLLIGRWEQLRGDLDQPEGCRWNREHQYLADSLLGREGGSHVDVTPFYAWTRGAHGDFEYLRPDRFLGIEADEEKRRHSMDRIAELIDAEVAGLRARLSVMDTRGIDAERALAGQRALFDTSKEAVLARKYEAAAERGMYRALTELREVEAEAEAKIPTATEGPAAAPEVPAEEEVEAEKAGMGSILPTAPDEAGQGGVARVEAGSERRDSQVRELQGASVG